jgi:hypothetical protein
MEKSDQVGTIPIILLVVLFISLFVSCGYITVAVWPHECTDGKCPDTQTHLLYWTFVFPRAVNLLLLVVATGALGALIHATSSLADYIGNRQLSISWVWWLLLRIPVGIALALVMYLLIRGGLIIPNGSTEPQINPYGTAGLAALVGMFAKQATDKLADVFDTLFKSDRDKARGEPLTSDGAGGSAGSQQSTVVNRPARAPEKGLGGPIMAGQPGAD